MLDFDQKQFLSILQSRPLRAAASGEGAGRGGGPIRDDDKWSPKKCTLRISHQQGFQGKSMLSPIFRFMHKITNES